MTSEVEMIRHADHVMFIFRVLFVSQCRDARIIHQGEQLPPASTLPEPPVLPQSINIPHEDIIDEEDQYQPGPEKKENHDGMK